MILLTEEDIKDIQRRWGNDAEQVLLQFRESNAGGTYQDYDVLPQYITDMLGDELRTFIIQRHVVTKEETSIKLADAIYGR